MGTIIGIGLPIIFVLGVVFSNASANTASQQEAALRQVVAQAAATRNVDRGQLLATNPAEKKLQDGALTYDRAVQEASARALARIAFCEKHPNMASRDLRGVTLADYKVRAAEQPSPQPQPVPRPQRPVVVRSGWESVPSQGSALASWYGKGDGFDKKPTSSGVIFDKDDPTMVAHKTIPLGTWVILTNPENSRSITVQVVDRGPFIEGREFDLSMAAKEALGITTKTRHYRGAVRLEYKVLS